MDKKDLRKSSLFIGRWQPFHKGHKALIETVLKSGKPVTIAIRDTDIDHKNPYSTNERWSMIQDALREYGNLVKIIVIPDIDEVCYGRDVGYAIRRIELDSDIENVSGTKIREESYSAKPIIWLTGQTGAGKTTLANGLKQKIGGIILDGDEMRESISTDLGFSKEDRELHNLRVARLAKNLARDSIVIVSVIAPFMQTREEIDRIAKPIWVYVERSIPITENKPYEPPKNYHIKVNSDAQTTEKQLASIVMYLKDRLLIS